MKGRRELATRPIELLPLCLQVMPIKLIGALGSVLTFWLCCRLCALLPARVGTNAIAQLGLVACRVCLWWLGFWRVTWIKVGQQGDVGSGGKGSDSTSKAPPVGIVSNHMSYCDILLHMSHSFPSFVARAQTRNQPIIGIIR